MTDAVEKLNDTLQGEISAVEAYEQALSKFESPTLREELLRLENDHKEATRELKQWIRSLNGETKTSSGTWGAFTKLVTGTAKILGDRTTLEALREGEEHGLRDYESLIKSDTIPDAIKTTVRTRLIPMQQQHIARLKTHAANLH